MVIEAMTYVGISKVGLLTKRRGEGDTSDPCSEREDRIRQERD